VSSKVKSTIQTLHQENATLQSETSIKLESLADQIISLKSELALKKKDKELNDQQIEQLKLQNQEQESKLHTTTVLRDKWAVELSNSNSKVVLTQEVIEPKREIDAETSRRVELAKLPDMLSI